MKFKKILKPVIVYISVTIFGYFLFSATWGGISGIIFASKFHRNSEYQKEIHKAIKSVEYEDLMDEKKMWDKVPQEIQEKISKLTKENLKAVNWFPIHLLTNFGTFAILGFIVGLILKDYRFSGIIPLLLLFLTLKILTYEDFVFISKFVTVLCGITSQFIAVYLFSFLAYIIKSKKKLNNISNYPAA
ncbi:MAG TPA: hypothetical protein DCX95_04640 [Elusimicrobia bacterium]|nr:hypothetical protein [Elusimicrobiota bacterium]